MSSSILPITQDIQCCLRSESKEFEVQMKELSKRTGIPIEGTASEGYCIEISNEGALNLYNLENPKLKLQVDFASGEFHFRIKSSGKNQPLTKAVGVAKGLTNVLDLTGGLGGDSVILASVGCQVTICERHPLIALLLEDGLKRAESKLDFIKNIKLEMTDSFDYLKNLKTKPQVIYLDPMYPAKTKSALPRKEMQILESLIGPDSDQYELFSEALKHATDRVVVKRPKSAESFAKPTHSFGGTTTRYDMYLI